MRQNNFGGILIRICFLLLCLSFAAGLFACGRREGTEKLPVLPISSAGTPSVGTPLPGSATQTALPDPTAAPIPSEIPSLRPVGSGEEVTYTVTLDPDTTYWDCPVTECGHIFTHCLVAYPEVDLKVNAKSAWQNDTCTTDEFKRMIESCYARGYILIDMNYLFEYREEGGELKAYLKKTVRLPEGKKGLVISVDNVCYPEGEHGLGRTDGLAVYNGKLASFTREKDGTVTYSYDLEVFPIVEQFCEKHPDFSFAGARCMLAVSGSYGILGYRTAASYANRGYDVEEERRKASEVIAYLKSHGFYFGCHSYAHNDITTLNSKKLDREFELWNKEVKSLIGYTPFYVYPYGAASVYGTEQHDRLLAEGFHVFVGTDMNEPIFNGMPTNRNVGNIFAGRLIFCGLTLQRYSERNRSDGKWYWRYCNPYEIYDNENRYLKLKDPTLQATPTAAPAKPTETPDSESTPTSAE